MLGKNRYDLTHGDQGRCHQQVQHILVYIIHFLVCVIAINSVGKQRSIYVDSSSTG
jgi:hypothetical protein